MKATIMYLLTILTLLISCQNSAQVKDPMPVHDNFVLPSKILNEKRVINVWTPENYQSTEETYPVLYMPDGGEKEDFPHIANTLSELITLKKIPPFILVGIENTDRKRDLTGSTEVEKDKKLAPNNGGSQNFRNFIRQELIPEINTKYRTTSEKGIIGESLSGLFVIETFLTEPDLYDFYIAFDPSLWWNKQYLVKNADQLLGKIPQKNTKLWFTGSSATDIRPYTDKLSEILKWNNNEYLKWNYSPEPKEKHSTIFRATKEKALVWTLQNN